MPTKYSNSQRVAGKLKSAAARYWECIAKTKLMILTLRELFDVPRKKVIVLSIIIHSDSVVSHLSYLSNNFLFVVSLYNNVQNIVWGLFVKAIRMC